MVILYICDRMAGKKKRQEVWNILQSQSILPQPCELRCVWRACLVSKLDRSLYTLVRTNPRLKCAGQQY